MPDWDQHEREAYLTLALVPGIGSARLGALLERFGWASSALAASPSALSSVPGITPAAVTAIRSMSRTPAQQAFRALQQLGGAFLVPSDQHFPESLRTIPDPPTYLFLQGRLDLLSRFAVAIVGSREHSYYGGEVCRSIARAAAEAGLVVVSGMARGLDAVAHAGALDAGGGTIGVLGNGLGVIYPAANRELYERVEGHGLLLTEFPPGERPSAGSFPRRNRMISGLARVTIVVEAAEKSGALQTSNCALEQGREVLAVPGPITSVVSVGTNRLLRDGAGPLLELADLLQHYPELAVPGFKNAIGPVPDPLGRRMLDALAVEPLAAEQLVEASNAPVEQALQALSTLELAGRVTREPGGRYRLVSGSLFAAEPASGAHQRR